MEQPLLGWSGRIAYMQATGRERQIQLYGMDLLWLLAKRYYDELPRPSDVAGNERPVEKAGDIKQEILKKLGGE